MAKINGGIIGRPVTITATSSSGMFPLSLVQQSYLNYTWPGSTFPKRAIPFYYTGSDQTYTIPYGATSVTAYLIGGGGGGGAYTGGGASEGGGAGGYTVVTFSVTAGQTILLKVGGGGLVSYNSTGLGGWPNGGNGRNASSTYGGGGGGRTQLNLDTVMYAIAGGGGGGGAGSYTYAGNGGGTSGNYGGGQTGSYVTGTNSGAYLYGGNAALNAYGGGGGGDGYFGGSPVNGSNGLSTNAGGGSGFVSSYVTGNTYVNASNGVRPTQIPTELETYLLGSYGVAGTPSSNPSATAPANGGNGFAMLVLT